MREQERLSEERLEALLPKGSKQTVMYCSDRVQLRQHIVALEAELAAAKAECERLRAKPSTSWRQTIDQMTNVSLHQCQRESTYKARQFARHPLTCGKNSRHGNLYPVYDDGMVKLICPDCDYTQENCGMAIKQEPTP